MSAKTGRTTFRASTALLLELLPKTLEQHVRDVGANIDIGQMLAIARQVIDSLHHLHAHKVVHGDVKLNNFLVLPAAGGAVAGAPRVVLADFGCAVQHGTGPADIDDAFRVHATQATNFSLGNPAHQAPEVVAALARKAQLPRDSAEVVVIDLRSQDSFAAGMMMCVLSLGQECRLAGLGGYCVVAVFPAHRARACCRPRHRPETPGSISYGVGGRVGW